MLQRCRRSQAIEQAEKTTVTLPAVVMHQAKAVARLNQISFNQFVEILLRKYFKESPALNAHNFPQPDTGFIYYK